ncbi:hypothetical protein Pcinc_043675 [Petrolisthes cinctipes]|uniref:Uncharacterized protein n=1 Tax=Petrolisthes cinctipes TaxID=88211 RepID=A0AAE1BF59_PETCI|nr:hypothetical protein Pcinc_043675 [Petrolisthes cinctipes]
MRRQHKDVRTDKRTRYQTTTRHDRSMVRENGTEIKGHQESVSQSQRQPTTSTTRKNRQTDRDVEKQLGKGEQEMMVTL